MREYEVQDLSSLLRSILFGFVLLVVAGTFGSWGPSWDKGAHESGNVVVNNAAFRDGRSAGVATQPGPGQEKQDLKRRIQALRDEALALRNQLVEYKYACEDAGYLKIGRQVAHTVFAWDAESLPGSPRLGLDGPGRVFSASRIDDELLSLRVTLENLEELVRQRREQAERHFSLNLSRVRRPPLREVSHATEDPEVEVQLGPTFDWKGAKIEGDVLDGLLNETTTTAKRCYVSALKQNPMAGGRIVLRIEVGRRGRVRGGVVSDRARDPAVARCIRQGLSSRRLPNVKGGTIRFKVSLELRARGESIHQEEQSAQ